MALIWRYHCGVVDKMIWYAVIKAFLCVVFLMLPILFVAARDHLGAQQCITSAPSTRAQGAHCVRLCKPSGMRFLEWHCQWQSMQTVLWSPPSRPHLDATITQQSQVRSVWQHGSLPAKRSEPCLS